MSQRLKHFTLWRWQAVWLLPAAHLKAESCPPSNPRRLQPASHPGKIIGQLKLPFHWLHYRFSHHCWVLTYAFRAYIFQSVGRSAVRSFKLAWLRGVRAFFVYFRNPGEPQKPIVYWWSTGVWGYLSILALRSTTFVSEMKRAKNEHIFTPFNFQLFGLLLNFSVC